MKCVALFAPAGSSGPLLLMMPDRMATDGRMPGDGGRAIVRLEFEELRTVHDMRDHLAHVQRLAVVSQRNAE